jgi:hypothetical protein
MKLHAPKERFGHTGGNLADHETTERLGALANGSEIAAQSL